MVTKWFSVIRNRSALQVGILLESEMNFCRKESNEENGIFWDIQAQNNWPINNSYCWIFFHWINISAYFFVQFEYSIISSTGSKRYTIKYTYCMMQSYHDTFEFYSYFILNVFNTYTHVWSNLMIMIAKLLL